MGIDFDKLVNGPCVATFGEGSLTGKVRYTPKDGPAFDLDGVFDEAWATVTFSQGRHGSMAPISTTKPVFSCQASALPEGVTPQQGDSFVRKGNTYTVADVQPDGFGWFILSLN